MMVKAKAKAKAEVADYYQALGRAISSLNSPVPLRHRLQLALKSASRGLGVSGCALMLLDSRGKHLMPVASYMLNDWYVKKGLLDVDKSMGEVLNGEPVTVLDAGSDSRVQYREFARRAGITSIVSVPFKGKDGIIGALRAYSQERRQFTKPEISFLNTIANLCCITMQNTGPKEGLEEGRDEHVGSNGVTLNASTHRLASELRKPLHFAHQSEEEFVRLLDFYRIEWLYEPRSFPLEWDGERSTEMFTPDFYLPEMDLYIEITTMKQRLATEKNRKVRLLKQLYPDINIRLLNKSGFYGLLAKYGYGMRLETKEGAAIRTLISSAQIQRKARLLGRRISKDYAGKQLVLVGILKGVVPFLSDLMRSISLNLSVEFMSISYYSDDAQQAVRITKDLDSSIAGLDVLMVEDIIDTGMTLNYVLSHLRGHSPASLRVCTLLDKRERRLVDLPLDYIGFEIADEFVVGYGLDYLGEYRNLPFVGVLNKRGKEDKSQNVTV